MGCFVRKYLVLLKTGNVTAVNIKALGIEVLSAIGVALRLLGRRLGEREQGT